MSTSPAKILAVDDDPHTRALLQELVCGLGFTCSLACDGREALERIAGERPDLVLLDLMMPRLDGFGVLAELRREPETKALPVILITALGDIDGKIKGLELGADDYLTKPFKLFELVTRINSALSVQRYRTQLRAAEDQLADVRGSDPLTGAGTYPQLRQALEHEVSRARRYSHPLSAAILAVDAFDALRESLGHDASDQALVGVVDTMRRQLREVDLVFRLDVEEFLALLPETDAAGAEICGRRICERVGELRFAAPAGDAVVRLSFGTATFPGPDVLAPEDLVRRANEALVASKRTR